MDLAHDVTTICHRHERIKMKRIILFFTCLLCLRVDSIKVQVEQGWLEGEQLDLVTGDGQYYSYKGIPYAAPPVGLLRFKEPQVALKWEGIRNATQHGSVCIQFDPFITKAVIGSEDCLFLNVYTPLLDTKKLFPVMVFIHGGGYEIGSGNVDTYGPDFIVQHDVVLVTFNYRLEALGFLSLDTEDITGNAGMKDQVATLKWVKRNIKRFGGDPERVTLFGQSAGGAATILHMLSPLSKGLFNRAIAMSGVPSCDWSIAYQPRRRAFVLGNQLGNSTENTKQLFEFLQNLPAEELANVEPSVLVTEEIPAKTYKMFQFTPVVEKDFGQDHFITEEPEKLLKDGKVHTHEVMLGHTSEEAILDLFPLEDIFLSKYSIFKELFVPRKIMYEKSPTKLLELADIIKKHYFGTKPIGKETIRELLTYLNEAIYGYDTYRYIQIFNKINSKLYVYKFSGVAERNIRGKFAYKYNIVGASHEDDLAYLFDPKNEKLSLEKDSKEYKIVMSISKLWTNFAKYGNPTPSTDLTSWPPYNNSTWSYLDISEQLTVGKDLDKQAGDFWRSVFEKAGMEFDYFDRLYTK